MGYLEPIYLNEKMLLNCAAYILKGVTLETEHAERDQKSGSANVQIGFKLLSNLISPIDAKLSGELSREVTTKSARRFTVGGLHMSLVDELKNQRILVSGDVINDSLESGNFLDIDAILKPIDLFSIIEAAKIAAPIGSQFLVNFGEGINSNIFNRNLVKKIPDYEKLLSDTLLKLEEDYLSSGQIEMIMIDPKTGEQIGVVDLDVQDDSASSVKARLTDGRFRVIGKVTRSYSKDQKLSLVQRSVLSSVVEIVDKLAEAGGSARNFRSQTAATKTFIEQVCQLEIKGPAIRVAAMSVCV